MNPEDIIKSIPDEDKDYDKHCGNRLQASKQRN